MTVIANIIVSLVAAFVAYRGGVDPWLCGIVWFVVFRVETLFDIQLAALKALTCIVAADTMRMQVEAEELQSARARHEQNVAQIARNN